MAGPTWSLMSPGKAKGIIQGLCEAYKRTGGQGTHS